MRKAFAILCCLVGLVACDKHDPILPGVRTAIFDSPRLDVQNQNITDIPTQAVVVDNSLCPYTQDSSNVIWDGERKIFSGFPTNNTVKNDMRPVCFGKYLYAGLTTGEVIKINPKNRQIIWIADIYRASNLTGGASMVDIVVPPFPHGDSVYAGGLGDAFCRLNANSGAKVWCLALSVSTPFIIAGNYAFVIADDDNLYAIRLSDGVVYWRASISKRVAPTYKDGVITVGRDRVDVSTGKINL